MVSGIVNKGFIRMGSKYYLGPYNNGSFKVVEISNIHCKKIPVKMVNKGQYCSIWIKSLEKIKREDLRKGMVLLDLQIKPVATKMFEADIWTIDGTRKTLKSKYQPVLNIKHIRQGCRIVEFKNNHITSKNNSSNNLISYANNTTNSNKIISNNKLKESENIDKSPLFENNNDKLKLNSLKNFVENNVLSIDSNSVDNIVKLTNIHPLKNLIDNNESKMNLCKNTENLNQEICPKIELKNPNFNIDSKVETNTYLEQETKIPIHSETFIDDNQNIIEYSNKKTKKKSINGLRKRDYNSDNAIKTNTNNKKDEKAHKQLQKKKSSISKREDIDVKIKQEFNSDTNIIRLNELNNEYDNLRQVDFEETCVISQNHNCTVVFEFMYNPEYITEDANIIISDQLIKAHGIVRKLLI